MSDLDRTAPERIPSAVERVLDRTPCADLDSYLDRGGLTGLRAARAMAPGEVIDVIRSAGLRGRGGAGFPTATKWATVLEFASPDGPPTVVVNAAEGEPGTFKDRAIIRANPFRVLEGGLIACHVVGARELVVATKESFAPETERLRDAARELAAGWSAGVDIRIAHGPSHYLFGEETALLSVIGGGPAFPRVTPPFRRGVDDAEPDDPPELATNDPGSGAPPALVNNVETFANVPGILAHGADWYRELGTPDSPGTVVCTITGSTARHGVAELPMGTPLTLAIDEIGGGPREGRRLVGAISGVANPFVPATAFETPLSYEGMERTGSGLGSAGYVVFDDGDDLREVAAQISRFLAVESCGQCEPCKRDGLAIAASFDGTDDDSLVRDRRDRLATVADNARCSLARQHRDVISSLLDAVDDECADPDAPPPLGERAVVLPILDLADGVARLDETQLDKNPDWTFGGEDSGAWPAAAATQVQVSR